MRKFVFRLERLALNMRGFKSHHLQTSNARIHVFDAKGTGSGPPLVMLHGVGARATEFGPVLNHLRRVFSRVIAPDLPGHGTSGAMREPTADGMLDSLREALDQLVDQPVALWGNSLGGGAAMRYAAAHPDRITHLILASPAGSPMSPEELKQTLSIFHPTSTRDARDLLGRIFHRPPLVARSRPVLQLIRSNFNDPQIRAFIDTLHVGDLLSDDEFAQIREPVMVIWGTEDRILARHHLDYLRSHLPASTIFHEPEKVGHCPHFDDPRKLAHLITDFVTTTPPGQSESRPEPHNP